MCHTKRAEPAAPEELERGPRRRVCLSHGTGEIIGRVRTYVALAVAIWAIWASSRQQRPQLIPCSMGGFGIDSLTQFSRLSLRTVSSQLRLSLSPWPFRSRCRVHSREREKKKKKKKRGGGGTEKEREKVTVFYAESREKARERKREKEGGGREKGRDRGERERGREREGGRERELKLKNFILRVL